MIDGYGRKINYVRLSVTDLCNLKCKYCMPEGGVHKRSHHDILRLEDSKRIIETMVELGVDKVRLTGGEPLVRKGIVHLVSELASLDAIKDLSMTTNGILLEKYAKGLKDAGLNRVNISIDSLKAERFSEITRGGNIDDVLKGVEEAKAVGLTPIKINVVLINGFNTDEIQDFIELADETIEVRFIELMPIGEAAEWNIEKFISNGEVIEQYANMLGDEIESDGPSRYFMRADGKAKIGFINPISDHFCSTCNRLRVTADGFLKPCLHSDSDINLKPFINDHEGLLKQIELGTQMKPMKHSINDVDFVPIKREMFRIGG